MKDNPDTETPAIAAAWQRNANPLASAAYWSATRKGGSAWQNAAAEMPAPVTSIADIYPAKP